MTCDLSGIPDDVRELISDALELRQQTLQQIVNEKAGTGEISLINGRLTEIIKDERSKGFNKSAIDGFMYETNKAKIHYSKTGVHIVPTLKELNHD